MKLMILLGLFSLTSMLHASEVTVLESSLTRVQNSYQTVNTRFQVNQTSGQGFVEVTVFENRYTWNHHYPGPNYPGPGRGGHYPMPQPVPTVIYQNKVAVEGLMLMGNKLIYHDVAEDVECGNLGLSRIFKRPTLYLTGNCKLTGKVDRRKNLSVTLITK